jgi:hypothetical protein
MADEGDEIWKMTGMKYGRGKDWRWWMKGMKYGR